MVKKAVGAHPQMYRSAHMINNEGFSLAKN